MRRFSERKGLSPVSDVIQIGGMSDELRTSLWNVFDIFLWSTEHYTYYQYGSPYIYHLAEPLWFLYFKKPLDTIPKNGSATLQVIRDYFFSCEWYETYDFIEFVAKQYESKERMHRALNKVLERELSGYRLIGNKIVDITDEQEIEMLEEALSDTRFKTISAHLRRALELMSDRENPDYRNSIKESISAVEGMVRIITNNDKATLGDALKMMEKDGRLHPALKNGFSSLYGYTNDADGIRHAMMSESNLDVADAKFFLLSCTSFVNYLKSKL